MKLITVQPSAFTDNVWIVNRDPEDPDYSPDTDTTEFVEGHRLPYPFHAYEDGLIHRQEFWRGKPVRIVGFTRRPEDRTIALWWRDVVKDPESCVGMYLVTQDVGGGMATHQTAIESVEVRTVDPSFYETDKATLKETDND